MKFADMKDSEFCSKEYLRVAKYLFDSYNKVYTDDEFQYWWREPICPNLDFRAVKPFQLVFKPKHTPAGNRWYDDAKLWKIRKEEYLSIRDHRVFSLLLMHEIAKDYKK